MNRAERRAEREEDPIQIPKINWTRLEKDAKAKSGLFWASSIIASAIVGFSICLVAFVVDYSNSAQTILTGILLIWSSLVTIFTIGKYQKNINIVFGKREEGKYKSKR